MYCDSFPTHPSKTPHPLTQRPPEIAELLQGLRGVRGGEGVVSGSADVLC